MASLNPSAGMPTPSQSRDTTPAPVEKPVPGAPPAAAPPAGDAAQDAAQSPEPAPAPAAQNPEPALAPAAQNPEPAPTPAAQNPEPPAAKVVEPPATGSNVDSEQIPSQKRKAPHAADGIPGGNKRGRWADVTDEELKYVLEKLKLPTDGKKEVKIQRLEQEHWTQEDVVEWKNSGGKSGKTLKVGKLEEIRQNILARKNKSGHAPNKEDTPLPADPQDRASSGDEEAGADTRQPKNSVSGTLLPATYHELLLRADVAKALPRLSRLEVQMPQSLSDLFAKFRTSAPKYCLLFWAWLEVNLSKLDSEGAAEDKLGDIGRHSVADLADDLESWDWGAQTMGSKDAYLHQRSIEHINDLWSLAYPEVAQDLGSNMPLQMGLPLIMRLAGKQQYSPLMLGDPENPSTQVEGQIIGRSVRKSSWLAIILPSRNESGFLRGYWVDGNRYPEEFKRYAKTTNNTLSVASGQDLLEDCEADNFLTIAVFQMKWGKTYHTHALGIPYYDQARPPALFSKSSCASKWGKREAEKMCFDHMKQAGQTNYLGRACNGIDCVSTKGRQR